MTASSGGDGKGQATSRRRRSAPRQRTNYLASKEVPGAVLLSVVLRSVTLSNRDFDRCRDDFAFLPVGERQSDFGGALACRVQDPHGALEILPSTAAGQHKPGANRLGVRRSRRELNFGD